MNKKSFFLFSFFSTLLIFLAIEITYLQVAKSMSDEKVEKKISFVKLSGFPDLAFYSENHYIRHRSLSDTFSIYKDDGSLREYSMATYTISHSHIKINNEK
ncbi:MAG: hypothetical protein NTW78_04320 [Campylobacterales bacterium]|nr:hypothetical protein [Campylobacterales bacterium]